MKVNEAIKRGAFLYPSDIDGNDAYVFLSEVESRIRGELFGQDGVAFTSGDGDTLLTANGAYEQIYPLYIAARRELEVGDSDRYSLFNSVFERLYSDYANYVNRKRQIGDTVYIKNI